MGLQLSKQTAIFGLRLWVVLSICLGSAFVLFLFIITLWLASSRSKHKLSERATIPVVLKEIQEIRIDNKVQGKNPSDLVGGQESEANCSPLQVVPGGVSSNEHDRIQSEISMKNWIPCPERAGGSSLHGSGGGARCSSDDQVLAIVPEVSHLGWGQWYTLRELETSTNGLADDNVIGEGGYGIVYHGILEDGTQVAVKNLLNNRGQAEREFKVEVEAIGKVRHKNLVRLIGYCAEGAQRMLVYEYVNNGNLEQWLHGEVGPQSPLTWEIRMNIILATARGLTYLHEGLEPKVVHRDIKSSNILLDKQWNAKVSDFGLAKLLGSEKSYVSTRIMGTFGYVAPEYANSGMLNEKSDIYSFGILIMEIISGRNPVDYSRPSEEVNLVDWLKRMVSNRDPEGVLDPKLPEKPTPRALKKTLLVALRCVDQNAEKRPKMGHIVHMLEAEDSPFKDGRRTGRQSKQMPHKRPEGLIENQVIESPDTFGQEIGVHPIQTR